MDPSLSEHKGSPRILSVIDGARFLYVNLVPLDPLIDSDIGVRDQVQRRRDPVKRYGMKSKIRLCSSHRFLLHRRLKMNRERKARPEVKDIF